LNSNDEYTSHLYQINSIPRTSTTTLINMNILKINLNMLYLKNASHVMGKSQAYENLALKKIENHTLVLDYSCDSLLK